MKWQAVRHVALVLFLASGAAYLALDLLVPSLGRLYAGEVAAFIWGVLALYLDRRL